MVFRNDYQVTYAFPYDIDECVFLADFGGHSLFHAHDAHLFLFVDYFNLKYKCY